MGYRIGVDIGGSFTDFAVINEETNGILALKVLSRPDLPGAEIVNGLELLRQRHGVQPEEVAYFTHGTTVAINTVIQRNGVALALFTTENFGDVLELARLKIPQIHNLYSRRPEPLIPRNRVFPVSERTDRDGNVVLPVDRASVEASLQAAIDEGCEGIVISLLHAYRNGENERRVKQILAELAPGMPVSCSHEIWPIIREYERTITSVISGYVQPKVTSYLDSFEAALRQVGVRPPPRITKSNGGVMSATQARRECVQMILSGTASGVIGAGYVAKASNLPKVLSLDIGGTSADVAVIVDGRAEYGAGEVIGEFQIFVPSVSVTSVGQGGGSIAWVDRLGVLKVGPESAGSSPGPACFGKGGTRPTVTDAFAVCGVIGHGQLGYDAIRVDRELARQAVRQIADTLHISETEAAQDIIDVAVSGMFADVSALVSRFGIDPTEFYFMAFGGAGPMLGCFLARELNMKGVVVPIAPGVLSALGGLIADIKNDFIRTLYIDVAAGTEHQLAQAQAQLEERARAWLLDEQNYTGDYTITCVGDMRYRGQSYELETPLEVAWLQEGDLAAIRGAFHREHEKMYGHRDDSADVQLISLRLTICGATVAPAFPRLAEAHGAPQPDARIETCLDGKVHDTPLYERDNLLAGHRFHGPAIVVQPDSTTCIPAGMAVTVDPIGNLIITPSIDGDKQTD